MSGYSIRQLDAGDVTEKEYFRCHDCSEDGYGGMVPDEEWAKAWGGKAPEVYLVEEHPHDRISFFLCRGCISRRTAR